MAFAMTPTLASSAPTVETEPVIASRRCAPYPVTTTSLSWLACAAIAKSAVTVPPAVTVIGRT